MLYCQTPLYLVPKELIDDSYNEKIAFIYPKS